MRLLRRRDFLITIAAVNKVFACRADACFHLAMDNHSHEGWPLDAIPQSVGNQNGVKRGCHAMSLEDEIGQRGWFSTLPRSSEAFASETRSA
jgi:hypothetical protein